MSVKMNKVQSVLFAIAVFLSTFAIMWQMYEIVIINELYVAFPSNEAIITGILSWPALLTAAASFVAGWALKKLTTKAELILGSILMLAGIIPAFSSNIYVLLICSMIMAISAGIINTAGTAIINEVYIDEKKRSNMMGFYSAAMSLISCVMTLLGGVLAASGWQVGFHMYWVAVPMILLCIFCLPGVKPSDRIAEDQAAAEAGSVKKGLGGRFWAFYLSVFIFFIAYCPFFSYISLYISENNLGGTEFTGVASTLTTIGSFVVGLVFGAIFAKIHRTSNLIMYILPILVYLMMYFAPNQVTTIIGCLVYGFCYGGVFTFIYIYPGYCVPLERIGFAMGLMTVNYSIGIFLGVYVANWLMAALGGSITAAYLPSAAILLVATIIELICCIKDKKDKIFAEA